MALKFYFRFENSGTLDGTHDYSAGDTTATNNGSPTFDGTTFKVGSYAGSYPSASAQHRFDPASILASGGPGGASAGAVGFWFYTTSGRNTDRDLFFFARGSASANDCINVRCGGSNTVKFQIRNATNGAAELAHGSAISDNTWYFVVVAWDSATNSRRISLYDSAGAEVGTTVTDTSTDFTSNLPANLTSRFQFGDNTGSGPFGFVDNAFIGDAYADADTFVSNKSITSYTNYSAGGSAALEGAATAGASATGALTIKKAKLLLDISAAGEVVSGAVWADSPGSITGDKFGEFTGQTIATGSGADAGFAVLKVPVSLFGGGSLNAGDTVQMFVRNATNFSDLWPATIIEE